MNFQIQFEREQYGRDCRDFRTPGSDGLRSAQAEAAVETLALRVIADRIEAEKVEQKTISFARHQQAARFKS